MTATTRSFRVPPALDLLLTTGPLQTGRGDRTVRIARRQAVRAAHTPDGPATLHVQLDGQDAIASAWGPGADRLLAQAPVWLGCDDDPSQLQPHHDLVARAARRYPGLRLGATGRVADLLVQSILGQKVTSTQAHRAWYGLVQRYGSEAPGPFDGLRLPLDPGGLAALPYEEYHPLGVERRRAETIKRACARIDRLEEAADMPADQAHQRLTALPGLGPWTAGRIRRVCLGDPDGVEWGDFHIPDHVCWNLAGEPRGDDARMAELLEPYQGQRGRALRLILLAGQKAPTRGPRLPLRRLEHL